MAESPRIRLKEAWPSLFHRSCSKISHRLRSPPECYPRDDQKEEEFLADLELLESLFVQGLQKPSDAGDPPPLPIGPERDDFIREVFGNHRELAIHIRALVERLHIRQREENPIIQTIGDLFLSAALDWGDAYTTYLINYPLAISRVKREMSVNPRFKAFVEACRRHPAAHKHPLENFLFRPPARLQRYHLHLESILKKTEDGNNDRDSLQNAIDIINDQCKTARRASNRQSSRSRSESTRTICRRSATSMPSTWICSTRNASLSIRPRAAQTDAFDFDWTELLAILFDNYFIVTKQREGLLKGPMTTFRTLHRRLQRQERASCWQTTHPVSRCLGHRSHGVVHLPLHRPEQLPHQPRARSPRLLALHHLTFGRQDRAHRTVCAVESCRDQWKAKLDEAIGLRMAMQDSNGCSTSKC